MAGHSQFKNIMYRKSAQDARRAKVFGKLIRELTTAARAGQPDVSANPRLRAAVQAARAANMAKDTIERAIQRGAGGVEGGYFEEVRYEGYGPGGVAIIIEALTDNRNRTASEIRAAFAKHGGSLGETNSVAFLFERLGQIRYPLAVAAPDVMLEAAIEAGADDCLSDQGGHEILCRQDRFPRLREHLEARFGSASSAKMTWRALNNVAVDDARAEGLFKLLQSLEDNDDVQEVYANYDVSEAALEMIALG
jgi:YebC/PmpR family DNA-binding regulatory protein